MDSEECDSVHNGTSDVKYYILILNCTQQPEHGLQL